MEVYVFLGSGCGGALGRAIASYTRDPQFESSHRQIHLLSTVLNRLYREDTNTEKEAETGRSLRLIHFHT